MMDEAAVKQTMERQRTIEQIRNLTGEQKSRIVALAKAMSAPDRPLSFDGALHDILIRVRAGDASLLFPSQGHRVTRP